MHCTLQQDLWHEDAGMASATGNLYAATGAADGGSYEYLKEFYEDITTDSNRKKVSHFYANSAPRSENIRAWSFSPLLLSLNCLLQNWNHSTPFS